MRRLLLVLLSVGLWVLAAAPADAANYYLKDGCTFNGTGTASGCAASGGASGAWNSVDNANTGWAAVCAADDILFIRARDDATETMATNNNDDARFHGGLKVPCSGTSGHPVTVTNFAGEVAKLANGPIGCTMATCDNGTLSTAEHNYVRIGSTDGLYGTSGRLVIRGWIGAHGTDVDTRASGIVIQGTEVTQGFDDGGNLSGIRLENLEAPLVNHNYVHDIAMLFVGTSCNYPTTCNASSGTAIKMYTAVNSIIEYNTAQRVCTAANCGGDGQTPSQAGGIDDKADSYQNTHRYNYIEDVNVCVRIQNQSGGGTITTSTGTQIYGNVCARVNTMTDGDGRGAIVLESGPITDILVHHNTLSAFPLAFVQKGTVTSGGVTFRDNVMSVTGPTTLRNWDDQGGSFALAGINAATNYNAYDSDADYFVDGNSTTIAAWRTASSRDANSHEEATVCGGFVSGSDTNFHLSGTTCDNESSTSGEQGAYGLVTCVGHLCGAAAAAPTVTSVSPSSGTTAGGTSVTITGADFVATPTSITFGGTAATSVSFTNSTTLTCVTPAHGAGAVDVVVTNPDTQTGTGTNVFTYTTPSSGPIRVRAQ